MAKDLSDTGYKDTYLTIMGDGPEPTDIKVSANSLGIFDKITLRGSNIWSDFA
ncbi:glycosyltransferase [Butyrivibrio hungatei]|uniref:glycosyltransferase n=1 Tax=Butyrivibrio hungatei TaxID=185008 RepID=UPI0011E03BC1|nr:glycosyltransferase [Butyrivibrio hungatei]